MPDFYRKKEVSAKKRSHTDCHITFPKKNISIQSLFLPNKIPNI